MSEENTSQWLEILPERCPPSQAYDANGECLFRAVMTPPLTDADFRPKTTFKYPIKKFSLQECTAKAISLFDDVGALKNALKIGENQRLMIVSVKLQRGSGKLLQTGKNPSHMSWWRLNGFDPLEHCKEVNG